jgi:hypothetical protein
MEAEEEKKEIEQTFVSYDEFKKMDIRVGTIRFVEQCPCS